MQEVVCVGLPTADTIVQEFLTVQESDERGRPRSLLVPAGRLIYQICLAVRVVASRVEIGRGDKN